jgi:UDP-glucose 4-epimerase
MRAPVSKPEILVVGGAGYIGSHMVKLLAERGYPVTTLDNLSTGFRNAVLAGDLVVGDIGNAELLDKLFSGKRFACAMHFGSFIQVGESVVDPAKYYRNNVANTLTLVEALVRHSVPMIIFSSSAALYGEPERLPIDETHPVRPLNPYGLSKWIVERILADFDRAYGLKSVSLRYFNAAGADPGGRLGERHEPETHLIPLILQAASGRREAVRIFGNDYDTSDGTCIRDFIHVVDLCEAHLLAFDYLLRGGGTAQFNLGNGEGFSVTEVIDTARTVSGREIRTELAPRRAGDPARLVADAALAHGTLGWTPRYPELARIIAHAWEWEQRASRSSA